MRWWCLTAKVQLHLATVIQGHCLDSPREHSCSLGNIWEQLGATTQLQQIQRQWDAAQANSAAPVVTWGQVKRLDKVVPKVLRKRLTMGKDRPCAKPRTGQDSETAGVRGSSPDWLQAFSFHCLGSSSSLGESSYPESLFKSSQSFQDLIMW